MTEYIFATCSCLFQCNGSNNLNTFNQRCATKVVYCKSINITHLHIQTLIQLINILKAELIPFQMNNIDLSNHEI